MHIKISKKKINIVMGLLLIILLMAFNSENADYANYMRRYNLQNYGGLEVGFGFLESFFYKHGFNFIQFRAVIYIIGTLMIFYSVSKMTDNVLFVMFSYFLLVMCLDAIQIRSYIAAVIVIMGMPMLLNRNKRSDIAYAIICLIAATMHISSVYYFLFLICRHISNPKQYFHIMTVLSVFIMALSYFGIVGKIINLIIGNGRTVVYLQGRAGAGILLYIAAFLFTAYLVKEAFLEKKRCYNNLSLFDQFDGSDVFILNIFVTLIPVLGLMCINAIFIRIVRAMFIFLFCFLGNIFKRYRWNKITKTKIVYFSWMIFMIVWMYGSAFDEIYLYVFKNNIILGA